MPGRGAQEFGLGSRITRLRYLDTHDGWFRLLDKQRSWFSRKTSPTSMYDLNANRVHRVLVVIPTSQLLASPFRPSSAACLFFASLGTFSCSFARSPQGPHQFLSHCYLPRKQADWRERLGFFPLLTPPASSPLPSKASSASGPLC